MTVSKAQAEQQRAFRDSQRDWFGFRRSDTVLGSTYMINLLFDGRWERIVLEKRPANVCRVLGLCCEIHHGLSRDPGFHCASEECSMVQECSRRFPPHPMNPFKEDEVSASPLASFLPTNSAPQRLRKV